MSSGLTVTICGRIARSIRLNKAERLAYDKLLRWSAQDALQFGWVMNNRKLTDKEALEQLVVCRQRLAEALHLFTLWDDLRSGRIIPTLNETERCGDYLETLRTAYLSWLASLIDKARNAINVFDVWASLYRGEHDEITKIWEENRAAFELLREFRNTTGFHGNRDLGEHMRVRAEVLGSKSVERAANAFFHLAIRMLQIERTSTDFQDALKGKCAELGVDPAGWLRRFGY